MEGSRRSRRAPSPSPTSAQSAPRLAASASGALAGGRGAPAPPAANSCGSGTGSTGLATGRRAAIHVRRPALTATAPPAKRPMLAVCSPGLPIAALARSPRAVCSHSPPPLPSGVTAPAASSAAVAPRRPGARSSTADRRPPP